MTREKAPGARRSATGNPPAWYGGDGGYEAPLPGQPGFVSLAWIDEWASASAAALRSLHERALRRKGDAYAWWPRTRPAAGDLPYVLASALRSGEDFARLTRDHVLGSGRAKERRASFFDRLLGPDGDGREAERLYVSIAEDPGAFPALLSERAGDAGFARALAVDRNVDALLSWMEAARPEDAAALAGILGRTPAAPAEGVREDLPKDLPEPDAGQVAAGAVTESGSSEPTEAAPAFQDPPPHAEADAGPASAQDDPEGTELAYRDAVRGVREAAEAALSGERPGRAALRPVADALLAASRAARAHEAALARPVPVDDLVEAIRAAVARAALARPGKIPAWLVRAGGVPRSAAPSIALAAREIAAAVDRIEGTVARARARSEEMLRTMDFALAAEIQECEGLLSRDTEALCAAVEEAARRLSEAQAEQAAADVARAVRRIRPAAEAGRSAAVAATPAASAPARSFVHAASTVLRIVGGERSYEATVDACLSWLSERLGTPIPEGVPPGRVAESFGPEAAARAMHVPLPAEGARFWTASLLEADRGDGGRDRRVDLCVGEDGRGGIRFGVRACVAGTDLRGTPRRLPGVVRDVVEAVTAVDAGQVLAAAPLAFSGTEGGGDLLSLLFDQGRSLPLMLVCPTLDARVSAEAARALCGAAHVAVADADALGALVGRLGAGWSVEAGGARIYPAGADPHAAGPGEPGIGRDHVARLAFGGPRGHDAFAGYVADHVLRGTERLFPAEGVPDLDACIGMAAEADRTRADAEGEAAGLIPHEFVERHRGEIDRLRRAADEANQLVASVGDDIRRVEDENIEAWARNGTLAAEVARLRQALSEAKVPLPAPVPDTLDAICEFAETGLGPGIVVMPKAVRETGRTRNLNIRRLYDGLVFLRDWYLPMRRGEVARKEYETALRRHRFEETPCFSVRGTGQCFTGYTAQWKGRLVELDRHLKWGHGSTDEMIRIYFHYDESDQVVVIGHMPSHLDNFLTN